jgi:hypothetical protein
MERLLRDWPRFVQRSPDVWGVDDADHRGCRLRTADLSPTVSVSAARVSLGEACSFVKQIIDAGRSDRISRYLPNGLSRVRPLAISHVRPLLSCRMFLGGE